MDSGVAEFGLVVEKDLLCAIMTKTVGVDLGSLWGILGARNSKKLHGHGQRHY